MICKYCGIQHPPNEIANPHYCIARMEEQVDKLEAVLAEKDKKPNNYDDDVTKAFLEFMDDLILAPDTVIKKDHMKTAVVIIKKQRLRISHLTTEKNAAVKSVRHEIKRRCQCEFENGECFSECKYHGKISDRITTLTAKMRKYKAFWEQSREVEKMNFERFEWEPLGEDFQKVLNEVPYEDD